MALQQAMLNPTLAILSSQPATFSGWGSILAWNLGVYILGIALSKLAHDLKYHRPHPTIKTLSEFLATAHLPIASYYIALLRAAKLDDDTKNWGYVAIILAAILAAIGVYQNLRIRDVIIEDHNKDHKPEDGALEDCPKSCKKWFPLNGVWTRIILLSLSVALSARFAWMLTEAAVKMPAK